MRGKITSLLLMPTLLGICPESAARQIQAFLKIHEPRHAVETAYSALKEHPQDPLLFEGAIRSLAALGEEEQMMQLWERFHKLDASRALKQELLEEMCWGILNKGRRSESFHRQLISLIGAALAQDIRALPFLLEGMRHTNAQIRAVAVELASFYGDYPLKEELSQLFLHEKVLDVRLSILGAIGRLELDQFLPELLHCIGNPKSGPKEKLAAIDALVQMRESLEAKELRLLAASNKRELRQLACEMVAFYELGEHADFLSLLMQDAQPEVCAAALKSWGLLRKPATAHIKKLALEARDPLVGITAAWVWLLDQPKEAEPSFSKWLEHERPQVRVLAAAAIGAAGPYGSALAKKYVTSHPDLYVQLNLALALAWQRVEIESVCSVLSAALNGCSDRWMESKTGLFHPVEKSTLTHNLAIPNFPEVMNQSVRLELLNLLAILEAPQALPSLKNFLKERRWGVTGLAAEMLLCEGDETAIELVRELLKDPDQEIRLEAALVLASWGQDPAALQTLLDSYPKADRSTQIKILEALGSVGDKKALPFLIERLHDPSQILRMVAATVLIQTLNR